MRGLSWREVWLVLLGMFVFAAGCAEVPHTGVSDQVASVEEMPPADRTRFARAERLLASKDPQVRQKAAIELLSMGYPRATEAVRQRIQAGNDPAVRVDMIKAVGFCADRRLFEPVLAALGSPSDEVKRAAARALSHFSGQREVDKILQMARRSGNGPRVRELLLEAIGNGLFLKGVPVLIEGLAEGNPDVRRAAWEALKKISGRELPQKPKAWKEWWAANRHRSREEMLEERVRFLRDQLGLSQQELKEATEQLDQLASLVQSPARQVPQRLLEALLSDYQRIREYAAYKLSSLDAESLGQISLDDRETYDILRKALIRWRPSIKENVVQAAVKLEGKYRTDLLLEALQQSEPQVLVPAIEAINADAGQAVVERLIEALNNSDPRVREAAAIALGKSNDKAAVPALMNALSDKRENVRWFAVESLRKLGATQAVPQLCELLLGDESARVREIAANALGELGQPAAVTSLRKALQDKNERVRMRAVAALQSLADANFERTMIIADALSENGYHEDASQVLENAIKKFSKQEGMEEQLRNARQKLATALEAQKDYLGAAKVYDTMDRLSGGDAKIRSQLFEAWLAAGEPQRILPKMKEWLQPEEAELAPLVDLGLKTTKTLRERQEKELAEELLEVLKKAARASGNEELIARLNGGSNQTSVPETTDEDGGEGQEGEAAGEPPE